MMQTIAMMLNLTASAAAEPTLVFEGPRSVGRYEVAEFVVRLAQPLDVNPFRDVSLTGVFTPSGGAGISVGGFCDADNGSVFRLRFCPEQARTPYGYVLRFKGGYFDRQFTGTLRCEPSGRAGPVIVNPRHRKHFMHAGSGEPFYHLGYTAYHLLDPSNDDAQVDATIEYCVRHGFNKIRFLLAGYPRDLDKRTSDDPEHGVPDPWKAPNYGARPGQVNPLPAWIGKPHAYDFSRFNVRYWQRVDRAVRRMRDRGIVATCIVTIEKQRLPKEYGRLTEAEYGLYRYAIARLAAFDNVWWDLGNEHNEYRNADWANRMGAFVRAEDPYDRLTSVHAYAEFAYRRADWADFVITQQYGSEQAVHDWALTFRLTPKPYVNEEYGYEGEADKPGHAQNADWVRRCHWSIAMAGGYATYGDWSGGVSHFYMGEPGPGRAARQLKHLRTFFESTPWPEMNPENRKIRDGFALVKPWRYYVFYLPKGGTTEIDLTGVEPRGLGARWFDPRTGRWQDGPKVSPAKINVAAPSTEDWVLYVHSNDDIDD